MQKANRLDAGDLLEIAAMKGMSVFTDPNAPANLSSAAGPLVGDDGGAIGSRPSGSSAGGSQPNTMAAQSDTGTNPTTPVPVLSDWDGDAVPQAQNPPDQDAHESD
jgi:hypothetical protein